MKHFKLMKGVLACLLSLALVVTCFTSVGAKAEETSGSGTATVAAPNAVSAEYTWADNSVNSTNQTAYVYILKADKSNTIKAKTKANGQMTNGKIALTDLKIKNVNKDVYLYVCDSEFEVEGKNIDANLIIKATNVKKLVGTVDYTKADNDGAFEIISAQATDKDKKEIANPAIFWSTTATGKYFGVNDSNNGTGDDARKYADGTTVAKNGFDGKTLQEMLVGGGQIFIKVAGVDGTSGTAQFPSKEVKVKIAKQAKAPKAKIDVKKDTIALKNGFDFALATKSTSGETTTYTVDPANWNTILPNLKGAEVKTADTSIVSTANYTPLAKKDKNAGKLVDGKSSYTAYKFKALSLDDLIKKIDPNNDKAVDNTYCIAIRKSATEKKPASAVSYIELEVQSDKPLVYTEDNVAGQFKVATTTDFDKTGLLVGTVLPNPGILSTSGESSTSGIATEGYDDSFKVVTTAGSGQTLTNVDTNGSAFEFVVVKSQDLDATGEKAIDWSTVSWKKLTAKTKINSKLKGSYKLIDGSKVKAEIKTESAQLTGDAKAQTYILIRRSGVKNGARASKYIKLYVAKDGKNVSLYSTVDNGEVAKKYTIKFVKFVKVGDTYSWQAAKDVEDISIWVKEGDTKYAKLPETTGAVLYKANAGSGATTTVVSSNSAESSASGYAISGSGEDVTEYIAIREYATVTVKQVVSGSGSATVEYYTLKNGKYTQGSSSGENLTFVGDTFALDNIAAPAATGSLSGMSITCQSATSGVTIADGTAQNTKKVSVAVNTADAVVITLNYTATATSTSGDGN